jgi:hypothetical protein
MRNERKPFKWMKFTSKICLICIVGRKVISRAINWTNADASPVDFPPFFFRRVVNKKRPRFNYLVIPYKKVSLFHKYKYYIYILLITCFYIRNFDRAKIIEWVCTVCSAVHSLIIWVHLSSHSWSVPLVESLIKTITTNNTLLAVHIQVW